MNEPISAALIEDHRRCDRLLARVESATGDDDWVGVERESGEFRDAMEHHFRFEEEVLFPALEGRLPMAAGPTGVMRMEHAQMRRMLGELAAAVSARSSEDCVGILETLHLVTQQHNTKEEGVLYPMADHALVPEAAGLLAQFRGDS